MLSELCSFCAHSSWSSWRDRTHVPLLNAHPGLTYLQHEGREEVEGSDPQQQQLEVQVLDALQVEQGFGEAQRVQGQPDHEAKEEEED